MAAAGGEGDLLGLLASSGCGGGVVEMWIEHDSCPKHARKASASRECPKQWGIVLSYTNFVKLELFKINRLIKVYHLN